MTGTTLEYERFPRDPIVEAILSLDVSPAAEFSYTLVEEFHDALRSEYPERTEHLEFADQFGFSPSDRSMAHSVSQRIVGYEFRSANSQTVIRALHNGFSFHHLRPYPGWDAFREQADAAWNIYLRVFAPEKIGRVALRYLDRIELPLPFSDLKEYLRTYPELAPAIDIGLSSFLMRLVLPNPEIPAVGRITQAIEPVQADRGIIPLVFDVDVSRAGEFPLDEKLIRETLERLRDFKNQLFFESITEKAKGLFR